MPIELAEPYQKPQSKEKQYQMQPPQNPYGTPNPYDSGNLPQPSRGVSMDVIGEAWNYLKPNIGVWIGAILVYGFIIGIFSAVSGVVQAKMSDGSTISFVGIIFQIIGSAIGAALGGGITKMAISHVRTGRPELGEMFNVGDVIVNLIIAGILVYLVTVVGLVLCIVPGIIASLGLSMTTSVIVDQKLSAIDAMKASWDKVKPHLGAIFVLFLVIGIINLCGALLCGLGLLVTGPLSVIALALVYRDLFLGGNMNNNPSSGFGPVPPIASPR